MNEYTPLSYLMDIYAALMGCLLPSRKIILEEEFSKYLLEIGGVMKL